MGATSGIRQLLRDLRTQKLRTFLTAFGIVWGTAAVSLLLAFGEGFHRQIAKNQAGLGDAIVIAWPSLTSIPFEGLGKGRRIRLDEDDMALIRSRAAHLDAISGEYSNNLKLNYGTKTISVDVSGVSPEFGEMRNLIPRAGGRFLNALDDRLQRRSIFIGDKLSEDVFGKDVDPVGKTLQLNGSPYLVVGVLQAKTQDSSYSGRDNEKGFIPGSAYRTMTGEKYVNNFIFRARTNGETEALKDEVISILAGKHRFDPKDKEALGMWDTTEGAKFLDTFMLAFRMFLGVIGSLTLVVGGIGVSNIMNVVVEERTREIGIKMALGARPSSILGQFLVETLLLTGVGGALGFGITFGICALFPVLGFTEYVGDPRVSPLVGGATAGLLGVIGLLAGWFPAREAANLDPVVAMKL